MQHGERPESYHQMLIKYWPTATDDGPLLNQYRVDVIIHLGCAAFPDRSRCFKDLFKKSSKFVPKCKAKNCVYFGRKWCIVSILLKNA